MVRLCRHQKIPTIFTALLREIEHLVFQSLIDNS